MSSRIFRVFISSTFSDYTEERNILHSDVYPRLASLANENGMTFEAVDLRWGIPEAAQQAHATLDVCLQEIRRCKKLSPSPNFVVMVGNRYGWEPPQSRIQNDVMSALFSVAQSSEVDLLEKYYRHDLNSIPMSTWLLRPVTEWDLGMSDTQILQLTRALASASDLSERVKLSFFASATHLEILEGLLDDDDSVENVCAYLREITDVHSLKDASSFLDDPFTLAEHNNLQKLRQDISSAAQKPRVSSYSVAWSNDHERNKYLQDFASQVYADLSDLMAKQIEVIRNSRPPTLFEQGIEIRNQLSAQCFVRDREIGELTALIKAALCGSGPRVIFVKGKSGVGKSVAVARALTELEREGLGGRQLPVFVEQIAGAESLDDTIAELTAASGLVATEKISLDEKLRAIVEDGAEADRIVLLDGLDKFMATDESLDLSYIPAKPLKRGVLILSADEGRLSGKLRCKHADLEILDWGPTDSLEVVRSILKSRSRTLTEVQYQALSAELPNSSAGLYLQLLANQLSELSSWQALPEFPQSESGLIARLVTLLSREEQHGEMFVRRALALLAASRQGLSESEIQEALGIDVLVIEEFERRSKQTWDLRARGILPPILWSRLRADLEPYFTERIVDGTLVLDFTYEPMKRELKQRFVSLLRNMDMVTHGALAYAFRPPQSTNNWQLLAESQGRNPRVLRSLREMKYHLSFLDMPAQPFSLFSGEADAFSSNELSILVFTPAVYTSLLRLNRFLTALPTDFLWLDSDLLCSAVLRELGHHGINENQWFSSDEISASAPMVAFLAIALRETTLQGPVLVRLNATEDLDGLPEEQREVHEIFKLYSKMCEARHSQRNSTRVRAFCELLFSLLPVDEVFSLSRDATLEVADLIDLNRPAEALEHMVRYGVEGLEFMAISAWYFHETGLLRLNHQLSILKESAEPESFARLRRQISDRDVLKETLRHGINPNSLWLAGVSFGSLNSPVSWDLYFESVERGGSAAITSLVGPLRELDGHQAAIHFLTKPQFRSDLKAGIELILAYYGQLQMAAAFDLDFTLDWLEKRVDRQARRCADLGSAYGLYVLGFKAEREERYREALHIQLEAYSRGSQASEHVISELLEYHLGMWAMDVHWLHRRFRLAQSRGDDTSELQATLERARENLKQQQKFYPRESSAVSIDLGRGVANEPDSEGDLTFQMSAQVAQITSSRVLALFESADPLHSGREVLEQAAAEGSTWAMVDLARHALESDNLITAQAWVDLAADNYDAAGFPFLISYCVQKKQMAMASSYSEKLTLSVSLQQNHIDAEALSTAMHSTPDSSIDAFIDILEFSSTVKRALYEVRETGEGLRFN